jgi:3-hydroxyisobutyrate dehydrogenase-like beta-hydroxyacid dehydrogenase
MPCNSLIFSTQTTSRLDIKMAKVSVLGSGMMGSALTRALLRGGHEVKVFDLDAEKMKPLVEAGATAAKDAVDLAKHAEILVPSLPTYGGLEKFLQSEGVLPALQGKTIIQLSSGSPETVQAFSEFIDGTGVEYLEGRIKNYPKDIGNSGSKIIFSGQEDLFLRNKPVLAALAESLIYMGPALKTVAVLDEGVLTASYGQFWGVLLAGRLCQAHDVSPLTLLELLRETTVLNLDDISESGYPDLVTGEYRESNGTATISAWTSAADQTINALQSAGLDTTVFQSIQDLMRKAEAEGSNRAIHAMASLMAK